MLLHCLMLDNKLLNLFNSFVSLKMKNVLILLLIVGEFDDNGVVSAVVVVAVVSGCCCCKSLSETLSVDIVGVDDGSF